MDTYTPLPASEEIEIRIAKIHRRADGIICVRAKDDIEVSIDDSRESFATVKSLANGRKVLVLSLTGTGGTISNEVQKEWISKRKGKVVLAEAIVAKSLAHKLIVNFMVNFYDLGRPMKMFTDETKAVMWLKRRMQRETLNDK